MENRTKQTEQFFLAKQEEKVTKRQYFRLDLFCFCLVFFLNCPHLQVMIVLHDHVTQDSRRLHMLEASVHALHYHIILGRQTF